MQKIFYSLVGLTIMTLPVQANDVWVSDEIEAPLRSAPELNSKIVSLLKAGQKATMIEQKESYIKIKTADGSEGWLSDYYVLNKKSVHAKLAPTEKSLEKAEREVSALTVQLEEKTALLSKLQSDIDNTKQSVGEANKRAKNSESGIAKLSTNNEILQKKLTEQNKKMKQLAIALGSAKEKASDERTRYLSLVQVSENAVDIDKQNRSLQQKAVQFELEIQQLKTENQSLKSKIGKKEFIIGALTVLGGILIGFVLSVMMPPRGRRTSSSSYSNL